MKKKERENFYFSISVMKMAPFMNNGNIAARAMASAFTVVPNLKSFETRRKIAGISCYKSKIDFTFRLFFFHCSSSPSSAAHARKESVKEKSAT
jgi:hypothetical protein